MLSKYSDKKKRLLLRLGIAALALLILCSVMGIIFFVYIKNHIEIEADVEIYRNVKSDKITTFYYFSDGDESVENAVEIEGSAVYNTEKQLYAEYDEIPEDLKNAFVAIEDKRFYSHRGVDW